MENLNTAAMAGVPDFGMPSSIAINQNIMNNSAATGDMMSILPSDKSSIEPSENLDNSSFHDTQGTIEVNDNGQLQFTLPIALPPAIKSVAPQINLIYTSGSGNGVAGYGWTISGVTGISRMGRNIEKDDEVRTIQFDYTDYYMFSGQRLILKSGEYGKDGAEYATEKYSNIKIRSIGENTAQNGPLYFEITFEDGSQAVYGSSADARTAMEYNIVRWQDVQGNYISYGYINGNNVATVYRIDWGGNEHAGTPHFNNIIFNYEQRELRETSYVKGTRFVQNNILSSIEVRANGNIFKTYEMAYEKDDNGNRYQFLKSITESNALGELANPVEFEYKKSKQGDWEQTWIANDNSQNLLYGDFDGDGKVDILKYVDAFQECLQHKEVYHEGDGGYNDQDEYQSGYWESYCAESVARPAGIYLFGSVFDDNRPKQVHVGSMVTKEQLRRAKTFSLKNSEGEILTRQGFFIYETVQSTTSLESGRKDLVIKGYSLENDIATDTKRLKEEFIKVVPADVYDSTLWDDSGELGRPEFRLDTTIEEVKELDIDGDGISELIFVLRDYTRWTERNVGPHGEELEPVIKEMTTYRHLLVRPGENDPVKFASIIHLYSYPSHFFDGTVLQGDFNGDGCVDFIKFDSDGRAYLTTFEKNTSGDYYTNRSLFSDIPITGLRNKAIVGDFTGDGKTDLLVPQAIDSRQWKLYLSTGMGFKVQTLEDFELYKESFSFWGDAHNRFINRQYFSQDLNKDGKADFLAFYSHINQHFKKGTTTKFMILYHENKGIDAQGNVVFEKVNIDKSVLRDRKKYKMDWYPDEYDYHWTQVEGHASYFTKQSEAPLAHYSPIIGDFRINNFNESILVFRQGRLVKYNHYSVADEGLITSIAQGGITTEIQYDELDPKVNPGFYNTVKKEQYPYVEMDRLPRSFVVSQLKQENKKQDFKYRGFVAHVLGKGMLGFRKSARSSWYTDQLLETKIWNGREMDPLNEGLPIKEWSVRTQNDDELIFSEDISLNNAQLLSFKSTSYDRSEPSIGVTAIVPMKTVSKDFLKDIVEENTITYGDYYLPSGTTTTINNGYATMTTVLEYIHNVDGTGKDYFVGRPVIKLETIQAYADTKQNKEEYVYNNHLLVSRKTYNRDRSGWVEESYRYDLFGNMIEKAIANSVDLMTQMESTQYDPKGRFVIKKTDNLELETHITYNDMGQILTQTDSFGNTFTSVYDGWGKLLSSATNLEGTTTYTYEKMDDKGTKVSKYEPNGMASAVFTNKLGQQVKTRQRGFNKEGTVVVIDDLEISVEGDTNTRISVLTLYDDLGRKIKESEPHYDKGDKKWNTISYDDSVFPSAVIATSFNGKQLVKKEQGRVAIIEEVNGYIRIMKKTSDPLGNVIISEDKGGIVNFSFNAAGDQISAQYGSNIVRTDYDVWGRKSQFEDPSNGLYRYEFNGFGQVTKEISPKGYKEYRYNTKGQLVEQIEKSTELGLTDKAINYRYDTNGLLVEQSGTSNGELFKTTFTYDSYGRLRENREESFGRIYMQKEFEYDDKSRIISYEKSLESDGVQTVARILHIYEEWSGLLSKIINADTGLELWRIQERNASGQLLRSRLGAARISNTYNEHNLLTETLQQSNKGQIFKGKYTFDAIRNELKERVRSGSIALTENFTYDDNNRLIEWTNPTDGETLSNTYDVQGRIVGIDTIGTVRFDRAGQQYRPSRIKLSEAGKQHYTNDLIQRIVYNENNDPLQIKGKQSNVTFDYGLGAMRQRVFCSDEATNSIIEDQVAVEKETGFTKFYSADSSFEVVRNNTTGEEKHVLFIGSSPYESNIVYLKDYSESSGSYLFLHKDYLGSILAISDVEGALVEERHFDAWGNLTHGVMKILDRGYTSHEHFDTVGIVHMNGRLYDPTLRRFLNADAYIQDMFNTQNYNKYGYVINNPLMYNDPSGEVFFLAFLGAWALWKAVLIGAAIGLASYTVGLAVSGNLGMWNFGGALKATLFGAVSGAVTFGIGSLFSTSASFGNALLQAGAHGVSQGVLGLVQGADFLSSAAGGFFGSVGAYGWGQLMGGIGLGQFSQSTYGIVSFGVLSGGVGAELTGGNFWQGAIAGGVVAGLNHAMHKLGDQGGDVDEGENPPRKAKKRKLSLSQVKKGANISKEIGVSAEFLDALDKGLKGPNSKVLGKIGKVGGYLSSGGQIIYDGVEYYQGKISGYRFSFRMGTTVTSAVVGAEVGTAIGGPYGFAVGTVIGIGAGVAESAWDTWWPQFKQSTNRFYNTTINNIRYN